MIRCNIRRVCVLIFGRARWRLESRVDWLAIAIQPPPSHYYHSPASLLLQLFSPGYYDDDDS